MKQILTISLCILALAACNWKADTTDTTDSLSVRMDPYDEDAYIHPEDFRFIDHSDEEWAKLYTEYVHDSLKGVSLNKNYSLCYIDDDDIPELCFYSMSLGEWSLILTQYEGKVSCQAFGIHPEYIERTGLIRSSIYDLDRTLWEYIYKLQDGVFTEILSTVADCGGNLGNPFEQWEYFVYYINDKVVDTLYGMECDERSCPKLNIVYNLVYGFRGTSRDVF
jgi:hypothetical protein